MRREEVVHDDEMDLPPPRQLDPMQPIKPTQQRMRVLLDVLVILLQDLPKKLVFRVVDGLDDEAVVAAEIEERARLARRAEFRKDVLGGEGKEVVGRIEVKVFSELAKDPGGVVLELEVVLG